MVRLFLTDSRNLAKENRQSHIYSYRIKSVHWVLIFPKQMYIQDVFVYTSKVEKTNYKKENIWNCFSPKRGLWLFVNPLIYPYTDFPL